VRQVETTGLVAAVFTHRDSRAGDSDLHTHVAVSNKVQTADGRWRALDGRILYKANVAASERYNTVLEAGLVARFGVHFAERPGREPGKRAVREIVGVDSRLLAAWSSRRRAIDVRRGDLAATFQRDHGRPPTATEAIASAQRATLETREAKHEPRSLAERRAA
jgi:conjugative relaxase-like TrwC/TraI family protein